MHNFHDFPRMSAYLLKRISYLIFFAKFEKLDQLVPFFQINKLFLLIAKEFFHNWSIFSNFFSFASLLCQEQQKHRNLINC